jgi:cobalamin-dependent methionine synthase I
MQDAQGRQRRVEDNAPYPIALADLVPLIDWSPFFHTWELRGRYPAILQHEKHGEEARKLFADARVLLDRIVGEQLLQPRAVYGLFPAAAIANEVPFPAPAAGQRGRNAELVPGGFCCAETFNTQHSTFNAE